MDTNDQLTNDIKALGVTLGTLLAQSNLPLEEKQAWLAILPELTPEQIDRLVAILEAYATIDPKALTELQEKLQSIKAANEQQLSAADQQALDELATIERELP